LTASFTLDLKAGPTWRRTTLIGEPTTSDLTGLAAIDAAWKIGSGLTLTEDANTLIASDNTSTSSLTALTAKLGAKLSARLSYQITTNSNPAPGFGHTDTLTRMTLVYGF
jgi:putative salt-induced outer membrane protein